MELPPEQPMQLLWGPGRRRAWLGPQIKSRLDKVADAAGDTSLLGLPIHPVPAAHHAASYVTTPAPVPGACFGFLKQN